MLESVMRLVTLEQYVQTPLGSADGLTHPPFLHNNTHPHKNKTNFLTKQKQV